MSAQYVHPSQPPARKTYIIESSIVSEWLPDGQMYTLWAAYDAETGHRLLGTESIYRDNAIWAARQRYPDRVLLATVFGIEPGGRS